MTIAEAFLAEFGPEMANTRKMLERVPDGTLDFKPHEKSMSMGRLAGHVAEMAGWGTVTVQVDEFDVSPQDGPKPEAYVAQSRDATLEHFDRMVAEAKEAIAVTSDEAMHQPWTLLMGGKEVFSMPRIATLKAMVLNHIIHHRAQLSVYLRLNDVPIPGMYGPSADEM